MNHGLYPSSEIQIPCFYKKAWELLEKEINAVFEIPMLVVVWCSLQWCGVNSERGAVYKESLRAA